MARILIALFISFFASARDLDKLYEKAAFKLGTSKFEAYIADDESKREQGLMFIEKMPENTGMLFVFDSERPLGFWMKNTFIPLSIAFPLSRAVDVLVPISCWLILKEAISPLRWGGIALVIIGLVIVAKPAAELEERL